MSVYFQHEHKNLFETAISNKRAELRRQANKMGRSKQRWLNELMFVRRADCVTQNIMNGFSHCLLRCVQPVKGNDSDFSCEGHCSNFLR